MHIFDAIAIVFILVFTVTGLVWDVRTRKLPNWLTVPMFGAGVLFNLARGIAENGAAGIGDGLHTTLTGFAVGFGILWILWLFGGSGGGDVKFMGALGSWLGAWLTFQVLLVSGVFAVALTAVALAIRLYWPRSKKEKKKTSATGRPSKMELGWVVPFGLPAALGTWTVLLLHYTGHSVTWQMLMEKV